MWLCCHSALVGMESCQRSRLGALTRLCSASGFEVQRFYPKIPLGGKPDLLRGLRAGLDVKSFAGSPFFPCLRCINVCGVCFIEIQGFLWSFLLKSASSTLSVTDPTALVVTVYMIKKCLKD